MLVAIERSLSRHDPLDNGPDFRIVFCFERFVINFFIFYFRFCARCDPSGKSLLNVRSSLHIRINFLKRGGVFCLVLRLRVALKAVALSEHRLDLVI